MCFLAYGCLWKILAEYSYLQIMHGKAEIAIRVYPLLSIVWCKFGFSYWHMWHFSLPLVGIVIWQEKNRQISHTEAELFTNQEIPCFLLVLLPSHHMCPHERWSGAPSPNFWASTWNVEETSGRAAVSNDCTSCFVK